MAKYHTLLANYDGQWCIEFGAYDRVDVVNEAMTYTDNNILTKIITTSPEQKAINTAVDDLNIQESDNVG